MRHRVFWDPHAEQQLERLLGVAADSERIVAAARAIDTRLVQDPLGFGESRYDTVRIAFERPLGVLFEVLEDVATVIVYEVWRVE